MAAVLAAGFWAVPASGSDVSCGDVISEDTTLTEDLLNCPGNGLEIGADGVTLDLAGHVVDGTGAGQGIRSHGNSDVEIKGGTIREFGVGVSLGRAPSFPGGVERGTASQRHRLRNLTVRGNVADGISLFRGVDANTLEHNTAIGNGGAGIVLTEAGQNRVAKNRIEGNDYGVLLVGGAHDNLVVQNKVATNERVGIAVGLHPLAPFSDDDNRIERNTVIANGTDGILVATAGGANVVEQNRTHRNGDDGIDVDCGYGSCGPAREVTLTRNDADRNGDLGIEADAGVVDGGRNMARGNGNPAECVGVAC